MSIRLDPRRLSLLKNLAAGQELRPGQLVQRWVEERLDAERHGEPVPTGRSVGPDPGRLAELETSVAALHSRVAEIAAALGAAGSAAGSVADDQPPATPSAATPSAAAVPAPAEANEAVEASEVAAEAPRRRPGRPRKAPAPPAAARVPLHEEIIAVIGERGPSTAAEIAEAIVERGRYHAPRSDRPLDASTVNSRVSNPVYRSRFVRSGRRIGLAE